MSKGETIEELARAIDETRVIVAGVGPEQADLATPCPDWDVDELIDHLVRDLQMFTARARGEGPGVAGAGASGDAGEAGTEDSVPAGDGTYSDRYERAANDLLEAWRARGDLNQTVEMPMGSMPLTWFVGQSTADILGRAGSVVQHVDDAERVGETVFAGGQMTFSTGRPVAVLIGQRVVGFKDWSK